MTDEDEFKNIMLDPKDVNPNDPESIIRYGKRCALAGEIWWGMKWAQKEAERLKIPKDLPIKRFSELCDISYTKQLEKALENTRRRSREREDDIYEIGDLT